MPVKRTGKYVKAARPGQILTDMTAGQAPFAKPASDLVNYGGSEGGGGMSHSFT